LPHADGRRTSLTLPNGVVASYTYDAASELTGIAYTQGGVALGDLTYTYDSDGRVATMGGNLAHINLPPSLASASYNADNQLTLWSGTAMSYDPDGNLLNDGAHTYTWDSRNQLAAIDGGSTASFVYGPFGRRISKTVYGVNTGYLYDGANVVQELAGNNPSANLLSGGLDEVFTRTDSNGVADFIRDGLGSTAALTDSTGAISQTYTYDPFGATSTSGGSTNSYQYTGREADSTGLYYLHARYYDPNIGRFISEDPAGFVGSGPNLYEYSYDSPITFKDPSGQCPWCIVGLIGGIAGGAIEGYKSYERGCRGWDLAGDIGLGVVSGGVGAIVGLGVGLAGGPLAGGAAAAATSDLTKTLLGDRQSFGSIEDDIFIGAALGPVAESLGPEVRGGKNFNPFFSPRTLGPKAWQSYTNEFTSDGLGGDFDIGKDLAGRKNGGPDGCKG
jgi:RHS repeat-associated protein